MELERAGPATCGRAFAIRHKSTLRFAWSPHTPMFRRGACFEGPSWRYGRADRRRRTALPHADSAEQSAMTPVPQPETADRRSMPRLLHSDEDPVPYQRRLEQWPQRQPFVHPRSHMDPVGNRPDPLLERDDVDRSLRHRLHGSCPASEANLDPPGRQAQGGSLMTSSA